MAVTAIAQNNQALTYRNKAKIAYMRANLFSAYMGAEGNSIIGKYSDLERARSGDQINYPFVGELTSPGVGISTLTGREERLPNAGYRMWVDWMRNGTALTKDQRMKTSFDIDQQMLPALRRYGTKMMRDEIVLGLCSAPSTAVPVGQGQGGGNRINGKLLITPGTTSLAQPPAGAIASAAERNAWHTANSDRIVYGASTANYVAGNFAASLATLDTTNNRMTAAVGSRARDLARLPNPQVAGQALGEPITPVEVEGDGEWYVCFLGQKAFGDLKKDTPIVQANRDARPREGAYKSNPIFAGNNIIYDGVIYREIPEISRLVTFTGAGSGSANVEPFFLCGIDAMAVVFGQPVEYPSRVETDYGFIEGRGIEACYGVGKVANDISGLLKDFATVTGFVAVT